MATDKIAGWAVAAREMSDFADFCALIEDGTWPTVPPREPNPEVAEQDRAIAADLNAIASRFEKIVNVAGDAVDDPDQH